MCLSAKPQLHAQLVSGVASDTQVRMEKGPSSEDEEEMDVSHRSGDGSTPPFLSPWSLLQLLLLQDDLPAMPCTQAGGCIETDTELKQLWLPGPLPHSPASQPAPTSKAQFKAAFPQYRWAEQHLGCLLQPLRGSTRWGTWVFSQ